jgi:hypothetical protein
MLRHKGWSKLDPEAKGQGLARLLDTCRSNVLRDRNWAACQWPGCGPHLWPVGRRCRQRFRLAPRACRRRGRPAERNGLGLTSEGRAQNHPYSTDARRLTRPTRFVPDGTIGRRSCSSSRVLHLPRHGIAMSVQARVEAFVFAAGERHSLDHGPTLARDAGRLVNRRRTGETSRSPRRAPRRQVVPRGRR